MQGVSQQVPRERLAGQVSLQSNMLSDVVEGMRRRPGMRFLADGVFSGGSITKERVYATAVDIDDTSVHVLVNVGMTLNLMPITGIPLPFFSYGGSFMLASWLAVGILMRISGEGRGKAAFKKS